MYYDTRHCSIIMKVPHVQFSLPIHLLTTHETMPKEFLIVLFWGQWLSEVVTHCRGLVLFYERNPYWVGNPSLHHHKPGLCWYTWVNMLFCCQSPPITYMILLVDRHPTQSGCRGWRKESSAVLIAYCHWFPCSFLFFSCCKLITSPKKVLFAPRQQVPSRGHAVPSGESLESRPTPVNASSTVTQSYKVKVLDQTAVGPRSSL